MHKSIILILILIFPIAFFAQKKDHEIGVFGGVSYYMGDINQQKLFYSVSPAFGIIYKLNLNPRYAFRLSGTYCSLRGSDSDFAGYQLTRNHSFNTKLAEIATLFEFNFFPYKPDSRYEFISPYIFIGVGAITLPTPNSSLPIKPVIPFGIGVKYAFNSKIGIAAEWTYRKTFTDYLDQLPNDVYTQTATFANKQRSISASKDWYSFAGISLTYKFALGSSKCPAYRN
jgi:hypothetical protein